MLVHRNWWQLVVGRFTSRAVVCQPHLLPCLLVVGEGFLQLVGCSRDKDGGKLCMGMRA